MGSAPNNFHPTIIRKMELSHYARCLLHYVGQVLTDGLRHQDTYCSYASSYTPLGFLGDLDTEQFLKKRQPIFTNAVGDLCKSFLVLKIQRL